jgi:nucleoid-associated protein YgaU
MTITDFSSPISSHDSTCAIARPKALRVFSVLILSGCAFVAATRCQAQDAAEATRPERARKSAEPKKSKHVYTDEDLRRSHILTREDQAKVEAKKDKQAPLTPGDEKAQDAWDATSTPAEVPLGDVARRLREQKQARGSRSAGAFHLPTGDSALAAPVVRPPLMNSGPVRRVDPFAKRLSPVAPMIPPRRPPMEVSPSTAVPSTGRKPNRDLSPSTVQPRTPIGGRPAVPSEREQLRVITVQPGDSLWKLAEHNLGDASRWRELLAVNPEIADADRIAAGTRIFVPNASARPRSDLRIVVQAGDTLSLIAQTHYRNAKLWQCVAQANPQIADANHIFPGQELLLPAACR